MGIRPTGAASMPSYGLLKVKHDGERPEASTSMLD